MGRYLKDTFGDKEILQFWIADCACLPVGREFGVLKS
jgi:hypothetical protein